jgi:gamma-glutamyl phosphate reductase
MIERMAARAKDASLQKAALSQQTKNAALKAIAEALRTEQGRIIRANQADIAQADRDNRRV